MLKPYNIPELPLPIELESKEVLKALVYANRALAELKGTARSIPNQGVLIDSLSIQEAKASSEIENIVTTHDELFKIDLSQKSFISPAAKEVALYREALKLGFESLRSNNAVISNRDIVKLFQLLKNRDDGFRKLPGTKLKNDKTGEIVYIPPQRYDEIESYMRGLEAYINAEHDEVDPLIKMAIIHHQFESIHPFPDGNGRIGRILNVLYLTKVNLLDIPILYLSRHITQTKDDYYYLLQKVRDENSWEEWVLYMLNAVKITAEQTLLIVIKLRELMAKFKQEMRINLPKIYSQDLLNNLFRHPYTRIDYLMIDLGITRQTASRYLDQLASLGYVEKHQVGRNNYYINSELIDLIISASGKD